MQERKAEEGREKKRGGSREREKELNSQKPHCSHRDAVCALTVALAPKLFMVCVSGRPTKPRLGEKQNCTVLLLG